MTTELTMPQMGYDMQEGTVVRWLKAEGSNVEIGEPVAEIETDKAVVEFESYAEGVLQKIVVNEGTTVPVGEVIAIVGEDSEVVGTTAEPESPAPVAEPQPAEEETHAAIPLGAASMPPSDGTETPAEPEEPSEPRRVLATPVARQIAAEAGIDLGAVEGTGPGGRVTKDDVQRVVDAMTEPEPEPEVEAEPEPVEAEAEVEAEPEPEPEPIEAEAEVEPEPEPEPADEDLVPLSKMRQQIARRDNPLQERKTALLRQHGRGHDRGDGTQSAD